jgi:formate transporter
MNDHWSPPKADNAAQPVTFEAILPPAMAIRAEDAGVRRASMDPLTVLVLSVLGGAFVAFGAVFATTVSAGSIAVTSADGSAAFAASLPYGIVRLLIGLVFCVGLILVIVGGAELFTGNNLIVMAWASGKVTSRAVLLNWLIVFVGNFAGAIAIAALMFTTTQYTFGAGSVGLAALSTAHSKAALPFLPALTLGIMCNALVCLTVWMCYAARTTMDRVITIVAPITAFAAAGFEHCVANMYFIPIGLFIKAGAPDSFWKSIHRSPGDFPALTWNNLFCNLVPVTIGNIIGGSIMVGAVYWFLYLRRTSN